MIRRSMRQVAKLLGRLTMKPRYPSIQVRLGKRTGQDLEDIRSLVDTVGKALLRNGVVPAELKQFLNAACKLEYERALKACKQWVRIID